MVPPLLFDLRGKRIYVAGHTGLAGSAIVRRLASEGCEVLTAKREDLDLTQQDATEKWIATAKPDAVFLAAARVGGIYANDAFPADFLADNLAIAVNVLRAALAVKVKKLMFLGSSCVFPRNAPQPMTEDLLLTGALEPTNEWYAVAKIAGLKLAEAYRRQFGADFISVMPTNLYGPGDNYHPENSHVPAALIRRFHEAKMKGAGEVVVWGTGKPKREFLAADDLGDACIFVMKHYSGDEFLNVGTGQEVSIEEFARLVAEIVGYRGKLVFDTNRPDGPPRKLLDISKISALGWTAKTPLRAGLQAAYNDFLARGADVRER
jgi:GDP-L-fucose synthase